jgi:hypothetical protein
MLRGSSLPNSSPVWYNGEELKPSSESGRFVAAQSRVPSVSAPEMEVSE